jgi:hypothetical protein
MAGLYWHGAGLLGGRFRNCDPPIATNIFQMNAFNALVFAAMGAVMEILPRAFPSWFPPSGSDQASARALWLALMGVVQISVAVGFVVRFQVVPFGYRMLSMARSESGPLAIPSARVVIGR